MARSPRENPTFCEALTLTTYTMTASADVGDTITAAGIEALATGTEIVINLTGGTAQNITDLGTYYVIASAANTIQIATTYANAIASTAVNIAGDAGGGTIHPVYDAHGAYVYIGTGGTLNCRGFGNLGRNQGGSGTVEGTPDGDDAMAQHLNVANGTLWPWRIGKIHSYVSSGTVVSGIILWY